MSKTTENGVMKNMEFLVKELHKEWERSGDTKATVMIELEEVNEVNQTLAEKIMEKQNRIEEDDMTFKDSMLLSKENYILLRLAKKIKMQEDKTNAKALDLEFSVTLDKEEYKLFQSMFSAKLK